MKNSDVSTYSIQSMILDLEKQLKKNYMDMSHLIDQLNSIPEEKLLLVGDIMRDSEYEKKIKMINKAMKNMESDMLSIVEDFHHSTDASAS